ncbi:MAG: riboflavin synthase [Euryarchaeota archaeon]|jgi:riboflavin synthase|nr:riboflavin synthase [Euryarchaeota archaeon]|tara:strand:- start:1100 stop:1705 length:606 start_codon:yes stop_codon:yes gene_type:complete
MFTGIVAGTSPIINIEQKDIVRSLTLNLEGFVMGLEIGASVSLDGVCMTVVSIDGNLVTFDAIEETLNRTTIGKLGVGSLVNIERSLKMGDELGGHIISGHVLTTAKILQIVNKGEGIDMMIENPPEVNQYILEKGYISIDGMSLTIGKVSEDNFSLHIIPETLRITTIGHKNVGDYVNIEIDSRTQAIVDTIRKSMEVKK